MSATAVKIAIPRGGQVSGLLEAPRKARACFVLAHGAGAGMKHPFLAAVAAGLSKRGVATLRYQFPYMERGSKRPDDPKVAQAAVRAAVTAAARKLPKLALFAGGKSFGGRMTSQAQAEAPLDGVHGLAFLGFPLHAPGKASDERGEHLAGVHVPMLFLQGSRDDFAQVRLLRPLTVRLGATLRLFEDADHSFHVPKRTGRTDAEVMGELLDVLAGWIEACLATERERAAASPAAARRR
ncbi:MAG: alpha/beta hydrolase family protein [Gammaproteobacteria bacterium]